jgi:hypothetical protein
VIFRSAAEEHDVFAMPDTGIWGKTDRRIGETPGPDLTAYYRTSDVFS